MDTEDNEDFIRRRNTRMYRFTRYVGFAVLGLAVVYLVVVFTVAGLDFDPGVLLSPAILTVLGLACVVISARLRRETTVDRVGLQPDTEGR